MNKKEKMKKILKFLKGRYGREIGARLSMRSDLFRLLITTILSQRTRDENTRKAANNLFFVVSKPEEILRLDDKKMQALIRPSGMFKQKAKNIKKLCKILVEKLDKKIPGTREALMDLPGVGNKTADIVLSYGIGIPTIAVDVHVEVCSKRLGLVRKKARYDEIRETLEELTPERERFLVNLGFVKFGQEICLTRRPRCYICPLLSICEYGKKEYCKSL